MITGRRRSTLLKFGYFKRQTVKTSGKLREKLGENKRKEGASNQYHERVKRHCTHNIDALLRNYEHFFKKKL